MNADLASILPNIAHSLDGTGFLFGAGTSCEAGYPMMAQLTREVVSSLDADGRTALESVLDHTEMVYDNIQATPNIEVISDLVIAHWTKTGDVKFDALERQIKKLILDRILEVRTPNLEHHLRFFEALKARAFGLPCSVWIFTTNYDLLFEIAAARVGVNVENGFSGTIERYFTPTQLTAITGTTKGARFTPANNLTVRLIKLHGSVSWTRESSGIYERHPEAMSEGSERLMVLPRRKKVIDTLVPPYDALFAQMSKVLGAECKYLVSCGYSFSDDHINQQVLLPTIQQNRCRLFALSKEEPLGLESFLRHPNCSGAFEHHRHIGGLREEKGMEAWKFSEFVSLFGRDHP